LTKNSHEKRVALVTGSTSGRGKAIAKQLAKDGFAIAFPSQSSIAKGQALAKEHLDSAYFPFS
jgi:NAD(P)-dependent dehydrogenase (short-subunit alcohol dehydrogenase family)